MRKFKLSFLLILVSAILTFSGLPVHPVSADGGGIIIEPNSNSGTDVATLNPILGNDVYSQRVYGLMFPTLLGIDPKVGLFAPGARNGLVKDWKAHSRPR